MFCHIHNVYYQTICPHCVAALSASFGGGPPAGGYGYPPAGGYGYPPAGGYVQQPTYPQSYYTPQPGPSYTNVPAASYAVGPTDIVISTHGNSDWNGPKFKVPSGISLRFYTPWGTELKNNIGFAIQTALQHGQPNPYQARQLVNGGAKVHDVTLSGDYVNFKSGIVDTGLPNGSNVLTPLYPGHSMMLSDALNQLKQSYPNRELVVHCLFCLV